MDHKIAERVVRVCRAEISLCPHGRGDLNNRRQRDTIICGEKFSFETWFDWWLHESFQKPSVRKMTFQKPSVRKKPNQKPSVRKIPIQKASVRKMPIQKASDVTR
jgi:hypothetical protein